MTADEVNRLANGVYFPIVAQSIRSGSCPKAKYLEATNYMVAISASLLATLAIVAAPLILILFGEQWTRSANLASLLCIYAILNTPYLLAGSSLVATGHVKLNLYMQIATQSTRFLVILASLWFTLETVVAAMVFISLTQSIASHLALKSAIGLSLGALIQTLWKSFLLVPFAAIPGLLFSAFLDGNPLSSLLVVTGSSAVGWLFGVWVLQHPVMADIRLVTSKLRF
jgi:O-antigen/teichoic acid export membrane protein